MQKCSSPPQSRQASAIHSWSASRTLPPSFPLQYLPHKPPDHPSPRFPEDCPTVAQQAELDAKSETAFFSYTDSSSNRFGLVSTAALGWEPIFRHTGTRELVLRSIPSHHFIRIAEPRLHSYKFLIQSCLLGRISPETSPFILLVPSARRHCVTYPHSTTDSSANPCLPPQRQVQTPASGGSPRKSGISLDGR
ncbi:hypothetical protein DFP72DRAFT_348745 [Ephemerocybe angulata]|uniref:Uncharacterized protein n=1 Tax=Ephemerocybe angulata TaxID=980116 RepID=A0A8H6HXT1_9AGAR|nr:hypothetical protein DFP72DRAFT_348745 [Tulosesus angulatus]